MLGLKSLLLGTAVVYTLCFTLFLYWMLVHNSDDDVDASTIFPKHLNFQSNSINDLDPHADKSLAKENSKQQYLEKVQRYKKEQKLNKISRKLIKELQPIVPVNVNGNLVLMEPFAALINKRNFQMNLEWSRTRKNNLCGTSVISGMPLTL